MRLFWLSTFLVGVLEVPFAGRILPNLPTFDAITESLEDSSPFRTISPAMRVCYGRPSCLLGTRPPAFIVA